ARFRDPFHIRSDELQILARQRETHLAALAGFELDLLKPFELAHRSSDAGDAIVDIELHDFLAGALARVRDRRADRDRAVPRERLRAELDWAVAECRIAQAMTERIERLVRRFAIARLELGTLAFDVWASGTLVVVEIRLLTGLEREAHGQAT